VNRVRAPGRLSGGKDTSFLWGIDFERGLDLRDKNRSKEAVPKFPKSGGKSEQKTAWVWGKKKKKKKRENVVAVVHSCDFSEIKGEDGVLGTSLVYQGDSKPGKIRTRKQASF